MELLQHRFKEENKSGYIWHRVKMRTLLKKIMNIQAQEMKRTS
jgi:hypothetical protein